MVQQFYLHWAAIVGGTYESYLSILYGQNKKNTISTLTLSYAPNVKKLIRKTLNSFIYWLTSVFYHRR